MDTAATLYTTETLYLAALGCMLVAIGALIREPRAYASWTFAAAMAVTGLESVLAGISWAAPTHRLMTEFQQWRMAVLAFNPFAWLLFSLTYARGARADLLRRWRFVLGLLVIAPWVLVIACWGDFAVAAVAQGDPTIQVFAVPAPGQAIQLLLLLGGVLVLMNLERTYRAAVGTMRWQLKYMLLGVGVLFAARIYSSSQVLLQHSRVKSFDLVNATALIAGTFLITRSLFRPGVFKVDVYPSPAAIQTSLTVLLVGIYLSVVGVMAKAVTLLGGTAAFPVKALLVLMSLVLLAILLLSDRMQEQTRRFVSRHFQRPHYDYRQVWARFTERTAALLEESRLSEAAVRWLSETFKVLSATIWLVDDRRQQLVFGASTSLTKAVAGQSVGDDVNAAAVIEGLRQQVEPLDLEQAKGEWVDVLRRANPIFFPEGGGRVCVPIRFGSEPVGLIAIGDRVGGAPFEMEDLDLLRSISEQLAASFRSIQLSRRLLQAKEMEAFQTMSTFFVHDLKNTASTLSLMVENLPAHFDDPAFREDALRALTKAVQRMNDLIARMGMLRKALQIKAAPTDLNELVRSTLANLAMAHTLPVEQVLEPLPKLTIDPEQMQNVITNLLLNANEALKADGKIWVSTAAQEGWAVLSVKDNGCGMSPEFIARNLFRPFQTTKKKGIGIGMFHSRTIVEAHRGRIEVESQPNQGTTFRVLLPLTA